MKGRMSVHPMVLAAAAFHVAAGIGLSRPAPRAMTKQEAQLLDPIIPPKRRAWKKSRGRVEHARVSVSMPEADRLRVEAAQAKRARKNAKRLALMQRESSP